MIRLVNAVRTTRLNLRKDMLAADFAVSTLNFIIAAFGAGTCVLYAAEVGASHLRPVLELRMQQEKDYAVGHQLSVRRP